jgi:hypothetical protein
MISPKKLEVLGKFIGPLGATYKNLKKEKKKRKGSRFNLCLNLEFYQAFVCSGTTRPRIALLYFIEPPTADTTYCTQIHLDTSRAPMFILPPC